MENYKDLMEKEIKKNVCICCKERGFMKKLNVHHLNGNHKDGRKENLIIVCGICHSKIHKGFSKRISFNEETIENILSARSFLLQKKYSNKDVFDRIKFERLIATNKGNQKRCRLCGETKGINPVIFDFVKRFDPENKRNLSYFLCKKCIDKAK